MVFVAGHQSTKALQPADRAFDLPAALIAAEPAAVLSGWFYAIAAMGTDQVDAALLQTRSQRIAISGRVVQEVLGQAAEPTPLEQWLDQGHFVRTGARDVRTPRQTVCSGKHHDLGAFAALGLAHASAPFFAEQKVPSAIASLVSSAPSRSSRRSRRDQARSQAPLLVQSRRRRQHVLPEGNDGGRSFQRAPVCSTQQMPSKQARDGAGGRPPSDDASGSGKRSAISDHCSSVSVNLGSVLDPAEANASQSRDRAISDLLSTSLIRTNGIDRLASEMKF